MALGAIAGSSKLPAPEVAYLRSTVGAPWGGTDNETALTQVFGAGWQDLRYETVDPAALFSAANKFVFLEGGADSGVPMAIFLTNNLPAISNWVSTGGSLFINDAAYYSGTNFYYLGFGVTAAVGDASGAAAPITPLHAVFNGPFIPARTNFTGSSFAHATVSGAGLTALMSNSLDGNAILAEMKYGPGHIIFGGLTLPIFQSPSPQAGNLLANILSYGGDLGAIQPSTRVAIYTAASTASWNNDVSNKISATGLFSQVDVYPAGTGQPVPSLAQLLQYGAVLVFSDAAFSDNVGLGNVLANYSDNGGGVVLATFDFATGGGGISGRIMTGGYSPFTTGNQTSGAAYTLIADQPAHPILAGVSSFNGGTASYHELASVVPGASLIAHWSDGSPLVGTKQLTAGRVAALNFYPPSSDARVDFWASATDGGKLMANALFWSVNGGTASVTTTNGWNGTDRVGNFGEVNTATYGQTFLAPVSTPVLTSFKLYFTNITSFATFRFYVMAWDGAKATGPVLFQSPVTTTAGAVGMQGYTFNTGQLALAPGGSYVAFVSTSTLQDGGSTAAGMGLRTSDVYPGGAFYYLNNGTNYAQWTTSAWTLYGADDLAFTAVFSGGALSAPPPLTVGIPTGNSSEYSALYATLNTFGFKVVTLSNNNQLAGLNVVVGFAGCDAFTPSTSQISNGFSYVQISDWGTHWTPVTYTTLNEGTNLVIALGTPHQITTGLPASWIAHGVWRYGAPTADYLVYSTDATLPSLASETLVTGQSRVLTANILDKGRAVFIGWNVYGPDAGPNDLAVLKNSILWAGQASPPLMFLDLVVSDVGDVVTFTWTTVPGYSYQIQYKANLTDPAWTNLGAPITAISTLTSADDTVTAGASRFYRVQLVP